MLKIRTIYFANVEITRRRGAPRNIAVPIRNVRRGTIRYACYNNLYIYNWNDCKSLKFVQFVLCPTQWPELIVIIYKIPTIYSYTCLHVKILYLLWKTSGRTWPVSTGRRNRGYRNRESPKTCLGRQARRISACRATGSWRTRIRRPHTSPSRRPARWYGTFAVTVLQQRVTSKRK